jgi:hypothetical protein
MSKTISCDICGINCKEHGHYNNIYDELGIHDMCKRCEKIMGETWEKAIDEFTNKLRKEAERLSKGKRK